MIVYHAGTEIIEHPLVGIGRDKLDFGKGFYRHQYTGTS